MDERIRQEYQKIYSELYLIILGLCTCSLVVKVAFFRQNFSQLWLEYLILVGSPVYRLIRSRMLGVVVPVGNRKKQRFIRFAAALFIFMIVDALVMYFRFGEINIKELFSFFFSFTVIFFLVAVISSAVQKKWQKRMEERYKE